MWRELIGSSVRLFPPGCFCVAVTCYPPTSSLTPPSISLSFSFILRLAFCALSFSFYVFFFSPCLSFLCHDPLKPSATAEELLCWVLWGGIMWAVLADVSIREVKRSKYEMKKPLPASLNRCIIHERKNPVIFAPPPSVCQYTLHLKVKE